PCPDQPVASASIFIIDADGEVVAEVVTDANGLYSVELRPGSYRVTPQFVEGLMGTAAPVEVTIVAASTTVLDFSYDTGIR
ncbi:MAG: carboxypeptidase-like regulatory domain-containing protein, partial [Actinomycetota bacterium]